MTTSTEYLPNNASDILSIALALALPTVGVEPSLPSSPSSSIQIANSMTRSDVVAVASNFDKAVAWGTNSATLGITTNVGEIPLKDSGDGLSYQNPCPDVENGLKTPQSEITIDVVTVPSAEPYFSASRSSCPPDTIFPKTTCLPSTCDKDFLDATVSSFNVKKNWLLLLFFPEFPIDNVPNTSCFFCCSPGRSSLNFVLFAKTHSPPDPLCLTKSPPCKQNPGIHRWKEQPRYVNGFPDSPIGTGRGLLLLLLFPTTTLPLAHNVAKFSDANGH
mmetsp:Transcript_4928/g.12512  ORF Transcript_4928/g.12512 Transcript_4928/m.12512 type:complete len:275 (+) Transcript_4928:320-1144(+)